MTGRSLAPMRSASISLAVACVLVVGVYKYMTIPGAWESLSQNAADGYYNLLVQGFRSGQLSLEKEVPAGLAKLPNPYDPVANVVYRAPPYRLHDLSYYKGRLYLYFGITPALILFWPAVALTGRYIFQSHAVTVFSALGFLASVGLLRAMWRRYFAEVSATAVAACALALGLATGLPMLLTRADVNEVAISCGYMLTILTLAAIWCALQEPRRNCRWLALASAAYGLAVAARPSLVFGAVILLLPAAQARRQGRAMGAALLAATVPILLVGLGLAMYNTARFNHPFEFGQRYQMAPDWSDNVQHFSLRYSWFNFRVYFLKSVSWSRHFPFVQDMVIPPLPSGHGNVEKPFGILTNIPLVWLAVMAPLSWRNRSEPARSILRWFVATLVVLFGVCALTIGLYNWVNFRYEVDFLPVLVLLAVAGVLGVERSLVDEPLWRRRVARWSWGLLLGFSVTFNLFAALALSVTAHNDLGAVLGRWGKTPEAIEHLEKSLRIAPDFAEAHCNLGVALEQAGRMQEAVAQYEQALRIRPNIPAAHNNLAGALLKTGRIEAAIVHYQEALRLMPRSAPVHYNLGNTLVQAGHLEAAMEQYEQALRFQPDYPEAKTALARLQANQ
jgi:tetratricopeptide (TPR) repeat protein